MILTCIRIVGARCAVLTEAGQNGVDLPHHFRLVGPAERPGRGYFRFHSFCCIVFRSSSSVTFRYRCVVLTRISDLAVVLLPIRVVATP